MIDDAVVCRGPCEDKVVALHKLLAQSSRTQKFNRSAYGRNVLIYLIVGAVMMSTAVFSLRYDSRSVFGIMFLALSAFMLIGAFNAFRAWRALAESPDDNPNRFTQDAPNSSLPPSDPNQPFQSPRNTE